MRFEYKRYQQERAVDLDRPVIEIILRNLRDARHPAIAYEALVDSGSDSCIFPSEIADLLGIDLTATDSVRFVGGVVAGERRPVYFHPVEIEVGSLGGPAFMTTVGFMPDFSNSGHGLLGRKGFFDRFSFVKFRDHDDELEIGKLRR
jgi:hypothetical protein